jgi:DNA ligase (NAD+)
MNQDLIEIGEAPILIQEYRLSLKLQNSAEVAKRPLECLCTFNGNNLPFDTQFVA